jgi:hypothetical protein
MKDILDQMEEHIAAIRNLQRNFDFHSKKLEKLMIFLNNWHQKNGSGGPIEEPQHRRPVEPEQHDTAETKDHNI